MAAFESVAAAFATLILFALFEDEMTRRHAKFVFAEVAAVGQLLFAFKHDGRRQSVHENCGKNGQVGGCRSFVRLITENSIIFINNYVLS